MLKYQQGKGMNIFDDIVPPNMDIVCETIVGATTTVETCSDPWNYYKGYGFDIILTVAVAIIFVYIILKR